MRMIGRLRWEELVELEDGASMVKGRDREDGLVTMPSSVDVD